MAKRFTDTEKWKKLWFSELKPEMKLLWIYILDNCDSSGIWDINFKLAEFQVGLPIDRDVVEKVFEKQYIEINSNKWFIKDFIEFQYKCSLNNLNPLNKAHLPVIAVVEKYNLKDIHKGLARGLQDPMDKDKDKEKDKDKDKDNIKKVKYLDYVLLTAEEHTKLKDLLGRNLDNWIDRLNDYIGSKGKSYKSHYHTILTWFKKDQDKGSFLSAEDKEIQKLRDKDARILREKGISV